MNIYIKEIGKWIEINKKKQFKEFFFSQFRKRKKFPRIKAQLNQ